MRVWPEWRWGRRLEDPALLVNQPPLVLVGKWRGLVCHTTKKGLEKQTEMKKTVPHVWLQGLQLYFLSVKKMELYNSLIYRSATDSGKKRWQICCFICGLLGDIGEREDQWQRGGANRGNSSAATTTEANQTQVSLSSGANPGMCYFANKLLYFVNHFLGFFLGTQIRGTPGGRRKKKWKGRR